MMTTNFIQINRNLTIKQAMKSLVAQAEDNDNISTIYVTDEDGIFYGAIDLKDLIVAREYVPLEELISTSYPYVLANETITDNLERLKDYAEDSIPVLDPVSYTHLDVYKRQGQFPAASSRWRFCGRPGSCPRRPGRPSRRSRRSYRWKRCAAIRSGG